jgi:hypothetical protein
MLSGRWSSLLLFVCFIVSAFAIPVAAHLPKWIEFELVSGVWWLIWTLTLAYLLFNAHEVEDDVEAPERKSLGDRDPTGCLSFIADPTPDGCCCFEFIGVAGVIIAVILLAILGIWFAIEFLIPGLAFLFYLAIKGMLARAINPTCNCEGNAPLALAWGLIWATAYTAPLALLTWLIQITVLN